MEKKTAIPANRTGDTKQKRIVLVGTYKGDQLERWPGWYCWPLGKEVAAEAQSPRDSFDECCQCANVADGQHQSSMERRPESATGNIGNGNTFTMATLSSVTGLWLYKEAA